jgi:uncharacterized protein YegP (UPF0339 family)
VPARAGAVKLFPATARRVQWLRAVRSHLLLSGTFPMTAYVRILGLLGLLALVAPATAADEKATFELYKDKAGEFRWRYKGADGGVLATGGQSYKAKADAKAGIERLQRAGTDEKLKFETYEDGKKETRWRMIASNGQVVATSGSGYKTKADAEKAIAGIKKDAAKAEVVEVKE